MADLAVQDAEVHAVDGGRWSGGAAGMLPAGCIRLKAAIISTVFLAAKKA